MPDFQARRRLDDSVGVSIWFVYKDNEQIGSISRVVYPNAPFVCFRAGAKFGESETLDDALNLFRKFWEETHD